MNNRTVDDRGISLVELIVVISIMAIMVGLTSLGISLMFSRDANYVAVRIDDALAEARTLSMSKEGTFTYVIHFDPSDNTKHKVQIYQTIETSPGPPPVSSTTLYKEVALDKSTTIAVTGTGVPGPVAGVQPDVAFVFSKSKGNLLKVGGVNADGTISGGTDAKGVYEITVTSTKNSSKISTVTLVATTGRHYTDK